jgi:hypothetical protein
MKRKLLTSKLYYIKIISSFLDSMNRPLPKMDDKKDPNDSLMDLMKNMYETGDDEMKRTIAKAWTESREKMSTGAGTDGGMGGGMGGMGGRMGGDDDGPGFRILDKK